MFQNKNEFIENIKDGKWFKSDNFLVKLKYSDDRLISLWLSNKDCEGMCFEEQSEKDWDIKDGKLISYGAGVYHFGSFESDEGSIYDNDTCELLVDKMKNVILNSWENQHYDLITSEELNKVWEQLENNDFDSYDNIMIK